MKYASRIPIGMDIVPRGMDVISRVNVISINFHLTVISVKEHKKYAMNIVLKRYVQDAKFFKLNFNIENHN